MTKRSLAARLLVEKKLGKRRAAKVHKDLKEKDIACVSEKDDLWIASLVTNYNGFAFDYKIYRRKSETIWSPWIGRFHGRYHTERVKFDIDDRLWVLILLALYPLKPHPTFGTCFVITDFIRSNAEEKAYGKLTELRRG